MLCFALLYIIYVYGTYFFVLAGLKYRQVGSHNMNDHSSRSHSMLTVYIDIETVRFLLRDFIPVRISSADWLSFINHCLG